MPESDPVPHRPEADSFDVRASFVRIRESIRAHRLTVAITTMLTLGLVVAYIVIWPPVYTATVLVYAQPRQDASREDFYRSWNVFRKNELGAEVEFLTSRPVLERVVKDLDLKYDDVFHPLMRYATHLWSESWPGRNWRALKAKVFPPKESQHKPSPEEVERAKVILDMKAGVGMQTVADANVGRLHVRGPSPRVAEMANHIIEVYLEHRRNMQAEEASQACESLSDEVARAKAELAAITERAKEYREEKTLLLQLEKDRGEIKHWVSLEAGIKSMEAQIASNERRLAEVDRQLAAEAEEIVGGRNLVRNTIRELMLTTRTQLVMSLDGLRQRYLPDSPEVLELEERIDKLERRIGEEAEHVEASHAIVINSAHQRLYERRLLLNSELAGSRAEMEATKLAWDEFGARIAEIPEKIAVASVLTREHTLAEKKYLLLRERLMQAQVSLAAAPSAPASLRVADYATPPDKPVWPNKKMLIALGLIVGLSAGIALAVLKEAIRGRVTRARLVGDAAVNEVFATLPLGAKAESRLFEPSRTGNGNGGNGNRRKDRF